MSNRTKSVKNHSDCFKVRTFSYVFIYKYSEEIFNTKLLNSYTQ